MQRTPVRPRSLFSLVTRSRDGSVRAGLARAGALGLGLVIAGVPAAGQSGVAVHVSTTSSAQSGALQIDDGEVVSASELGPTRPHLFAGHWQAMLGFVPGDIDGFSRRPAANPGSAYSIAFSLLSNDGGFLDGDALGIAPGGGAEVIVSEADILDALGVPAANIDLDAIHLDIGGGLLFSLQSDLPGTFLGTVLDGDVLLLHQDGRLTVELTESEVETCYLIATGSTAAIGDVQGVASVAGELWVAIQSPSAHDGAVLSCGATPRILIDEAAMGLGGAEINALSEARMGDQLPVFTMTPIQAALGDVLRVEFYGEPNTLLLGVMAGNAGYLGVPQRPGIGGWYLDPNDPWLRSILASGPIYALLDGQGRLTVDWALPMAALAGVGLDGAAGWSFQAMEVTQRELTAPVRLTEL